MINKIVMQYGNMFAKIGRVFRLMLISIGSFVRFLWLILKHTPAAMIKPQRIIKQIYILGNRSLLIISVSGFFVGLVLALQGYYVLNRYGSEQILGLMVGLSLLRELGPVVAALLYAGRAGTALTAEIGLMKQGEQLLALEMMAVNPLSYILAPRFIAGMISLPILAALFSAIGIFGGYVIAVPFIGVDVGSFWSHMQFGISFEKDVLNGLFKSIIFAILINHVALYQGYTCKPTPEGVSYATTKTVIWSSLMVLCCDFLLTAIFFVN
jgi:phospholipid/cholesterol/gamma-HCH transport system permease protein